MTSISPSSIVSNLQPAYNSSVIYNNTPTSPVTNPLAPANLGKNTPTTTGGSNAVVNPVSNLMSISPATTTSTPKITFSDNVVPPQNTTPSSFVSPSNIKYNVSPPPANMTNLSPGQSGIINLLSIASQTLTPSTMSSTTITPAMRSVGPAMTTFSPAMINNNLMGTVPSTQGGYSPASVNTSLGYSGITYVKKISDDKRAKILGAMLDERGKPITVYGRISKNDLGGDDINTDEVYDDEVYDE